MAQFAWMGRLFIFPSIGRPLRLNRGREDGILSKEAISLTLSDLKNKLRDHAPGLQGVPTHYGVLVPVVETADGLSLLFEVRASTLNHQPREVCFPGGKVEPGETPEDCALRETWEELSIPRSDISLIAPLDCLYHQSAFLLHPYLAEVRLNHLSPNPAEVQETFLVPFSYFQTHQPITYTYPLVPQVGEDFPYDLIGFPQGYPWRGAAAEVPIYLYEGRAIWGLTGRIVRWLVEQLGE